VVLPRGAQAFGPDAHQHLALRHLRVHELDVADRDTAAGGSTSQQVHRRRTDEPGDEDVGGMVVDVLRRADLLQDTFREHGDPLAERDRLDLVVGHVDRRHADPVVQAFELGAHLDAELRVQVRERLVEEEHLGFAHERASHRDPLALAARELAGATAEQLVQPEHPAHLVDPLSNVVPRRPPPTQAEPEVPLHGHVRVQRVVLEHHRDVSVLRGHVVHDAVADRDRALADPLQAGHHPQRGRLPAPRRPDQDQELRVGDLERQIVHRDDRARVHLGDPVEDHPSHAG